MHTLTFQITTSTGQTYTYEGTLEALQRHLAAQPGPSTYEVIKS